jgi:PPOX class probable F420-dependent enzyme
MDETEARRRVASASVARLASVRPDGAPHVVAITFAMEGDSIWFAVDHKRKRTPALQRLANIEAEPRVSLLVDEYGDDWSALWWVRVDGVGRVRADPEGIARAALLLATKYEQYRDRPPQGPAVEVTSLRWTGWSA